MVMLVPRVMRVLMRVVMVRTRRVRIPVRMPMVVLNARVLYPARVHIGLAFLTWIGTPDGPRRRSMERYRKGDGGESPLLRAVV